MAATTLSSSSLDTDEKKEESRMSMSAMEGGSMSPYNSMSSMKNNIFDPQKENSTLANVINIATLQIDYKTGREVSNNKNKWTIFKPKDKKSDIVYRKMPDEKNITLRSAMDINVGIDEIHEFFRCDINDDLKLALSVDKMLKTSDPVKVYDHDRCLVHSSVTTGIPKSFVKPRDFLMMKRRIRYDNYIHPSELGRHGGEKGKGKQIAGIIFYSIPDTHPDYVDRLKKHVRGWINFSGMIFIGKGKELCRMYYILNVDPCGKIPKAIINIAAPQQGMNIKHFVNNIDKAKEMLRAREDKEADGPPGLVRLHSNCERL